MVRWNVPEPAGWAVKVRDARESFPELVREPAALVGFAGGLEEKEAVVKELLDDVNAVLGRDAQHLEELLQKVGCGAQEHDRGGKSCSGAGTKRVATLCKRGVAGPAKKRRQEA